MVLPANGLSCVRRLAEGWGGGGLKLSIRICRTAYVIVYCYYLRGDLIAYFAN